MLYQNKKINALLLGAVLGFILAVGQTTGAQAHTILTPNTPAESQAIEGLIPDDAACGDIYRIAGTDLCTHGPDDPLPPADVDSAGLAQNENLSDPPPIVCDEDAANDHLVQVMYVRAADVPDRYSDYKVSIRNWTAEMDQIYDKSAHETNGHRHIRFVTDEHCNLIVLQVTVPATGDDSFRATILELIKLGHNSKDRKYVIFMDASVYCGIATITFDSRPGADNGNNLYSGYARMDNGCWNGVVAAHELTHILGGVQLDAPNSSKGGHCVDEWDLMCYSDTPYRPAMQYICPPENRNLLDCNHDDYYHTNPAVDSYLATHWNVANSMYLIASEEHHNQPPTVALSLSIPITGNVFTAPAAITMTAQVSDTDGTVTKVEFYDGTTLLATDDVSPFSYQWHKLAAGEYTITAKAYDDMAASTMSSPLLIEVKPPLPPEDESAPSPRHLFLPIVSG